MFFVFLGLWLAYAIASKRWAKKLASDSMHAGISDKRQIRKVVSRSVLLRVTIHFVIIGALFSAGAQSMARLPEMIGQFVFAWIVMLPITIVAYGRGIAAASASYALPSAQ